jgi:hypothetical protein
MQKLVNGKKIYLTEDEIAAFEEHRKLQERERAKQEKQFEAQCLKECQILRDSGLKNDAIALLRPDLKSYLGIRKKVGKV